MNNLFGYLFLENISYRYIFLCIPNKTKDKTNQGHGADPEGWGGGGGKGSGPYLENHKWL